MLLHNAMDRGKPQARAFAHILGGVERVEYAAKHLRAHPAAGVRHLQADKLARTRFETLARGGLVEYRQAGGNVNRSAARHGVPGVERQIDEDLFHVPLVRARRRQVRLAIKMQLISLADELAQHLGQSLHRSRKSNGFELHGLLVAERQQPARQGRRALAGLGDARDGFRGGSRAQGFAAQQIRVALDHRQQVVELVRDARGQASYGLQLLRLAQLRFQLQVAPSRPPRSPAGKARFPA